MITLLLILLFNLELDKEQEIFILANSAREESLMWDECLAGSAVDRAKFLVENNYWAHYTDDGSTPWQFMDHCGYQYAGENLAQNFTDMDEMHQAWMDSPLHRKNIENKLFNKIGVGCYENICVQYFKD